MKKIVKIKESDIYRVVEQLMKEEGRYNSGYHDTLKGINDEGYNEADEDAYLNSFQYVLETFINGQNGQLRKQLAQIRANGQVGELIDYLSDQGGQGQKLINWVARN